MLEFSKKALNRNGRVFLTVFVSEQTEEYEEGNPDRPSLVSKFRTDFFEELVAEAGLAVVSKYPAMKLAGPHYILAHA